MGNAQMESRTLNSDSVGLSNELYSGSRLFNIFESYIYHIDANSSWAFHLYNSSVTD